MGSSAFLPDERGPAVFDLLLATGIASKIFYQKLLLIEDAREESRNQQQNDERPPP
jgi:hypothetical protein